jgi:hypothetical protein
MAEPSPEGGIDPIALQAFIKRVRATLGHDLLASLGTIVNYASVIEGASGLDEEELRDLPRRIRLQAMESAEMLRLLLEATLLAGSVPAYAPVELTVLLQSVVAEISGGAIVEEPDLLPAGCVQVVELDSEIVAFAWRSFLLLENGLAARPLSAAHATVERSEDRVRIGLSLDPNGGSDARPVDLDTLAGRGEAATPGTRRFGLQLSRDLVAVRGGDLEICGRFGTDAAIFLSFSVAT